jgi:hypothetical protein
VKIAAAKNGRGGKCGASLQESSFREVSDDSGAPGEVNRRRWIFDDKRRRDEVISKQTLSSGFLKARMVQYIQ